MATNNATKQKVALKRIPKKLASREDFQREMEALLRIQKWGGHPHIWLVIFQSYLFMFGMQYRFCLILFIIIFSALHEHFDEGGYYYLILDLVEGKQKLIVHNGHNPPFDLGIGF